MNLYVSIERDETLHFVVRAYRDHRLVAEASLHKQALTGLFERSLTARECRIAIAANQLPLAQVIIRKAGGTRPPLASGPDRGYRHVEITLDDLLRSGERFVAGPLAAGRPTARAPAAQQATASP